MKHIAFRQTAVFEFLFSEEIHAEIWRFQNPGTAQEETTCADHTTIWIHLFFLEFANFCRPRSLECFRTHFHCTRGSGSRFPQSSLRAITVSIAKSLKYPPVLTFRCSLGTPQSSRLPESRISRDCACCGNLDSVRTSYFQNAAF